MAGLTERPRAYGFHATLKPPFVLAEGCDAAALSAGTAAIARHWTPFVLPGLAVRLLSDFAALVPDDPPGDAAGLAAQCVETLDRFRAPPDAGELAARRRAGLTPTQERHLQRWGYPYVFDAFRFHLTLTGPLPRNERDRVIGHLTARFAPALGKPALLDAIALMRQPRRGEPFRLIRRFPLDGR